MGEERQRRYAQVTIYGADGWDRLTDENKYRVLDMHIRQLAWHAREEGWLERARWLAPRRSIRLDEPGMQDQIMMMIYEGAA